MNKKFLASFLSIAMVLSQVQEFVPSICASEPTNKISAPSKGLSNGAKVGIGVGGGSVLTAIGALVIYGVHQHRESKTLKGQLRELCEKKAAGVCCLWRLSAGKYAVEINNALPVSPGDLSAFYFGEDAFKNLAADIKDGTNSCEHSTCFLSCGAYIFNEPKSGKKVSGGTVNRYVLIDDDVFRFMDKNQDGSLNFRSVNGCGQINVSVTVKYDEDVPKVEVTWFNSPSENTSIRVGKFTFKYDSKIDCWLSENFIEQSSEI